MNTLALNIKDPVFAPLTLERLLGAYFADTRYELIRQLRNPGLAIPILLVPVGLYSLFAVAIAGEAIDKDPSVGTFLFVAFAVMAVTMPALFGIGTTLALERDMGVLCLKRAQPSPAGAWLVAKIATGLGLALLAYFPLVIVGLTTGKLTLELSQVLAMSVALLAGAIPFCAMGLMIGTLMSGSAAPGYANVIHLPGCYLSGMFFPLPKSMYWQVPIWPQFHVTQLAMHAAEASKLQYETVQMAIASLVGYTILFSAVAIWRLARRG